MSLAVAPEDEIVEIPQETQYWFVRTDGGQYFDVFIEHDFIGIHWNYVTLNLLQPQFENRVKELIATSERIDPLTIRGKTKISAIYNKIKRFNEIKEGDIVVIPSQGSHELAFGIITDNATFWSEEFNEECPYFKRRSVKWITRTELRNLDPKFFEIRITRHAISNITPYADYIDRATLTFFTKNETATLVLDILQEEDIELTSLMGLMKGIQDLLVEINKELQLNENLNDNVIKLNLQSKGLLAIISKGIKTLGVLGLLWALEACGSYDTEKANELEISDQKIRNTHQSLRPSIQDLVARMDSLDTNRDKFSKTFSEK